MRRACARLRCRRHVSLTLLLLAQGFEGALRLTRLTLDLTRAFDRKRTISLSVVSVGSSLVLIPTGLGVDSLDWARLSPRPGSVTLSWQRVELTEVSPFSWGLFREVIEIICLNREYLTCDSRKDVGQ